MQRTRCSAFGQEHHSQQTPFDLGVVFAAIAGVNALPRKRHPASTMKMNILMTHTPQR
jgi:tRNA threonylcarbamoyladenosine modification (KEOPS) complex Cgi121 subunit